MTPKEWAEKLNGREIGEEILLGENDNLRRDGLVVVYGASDDLMEFEGAIRDEIGAYEGTTAYFNKRGLLTNDCSDSDCPHFKALTDAAEKAGATIEALWDVDGYSWKYKTIIPHEVFDILEDGETYCQGIVFALSDVPE